MTEYKYFRMPPPASQGWKGFSAKRAKDYDLVLIEIIDNGKMHSEACRMHKVNEKSFDNVKRYLRSVGLVIPSKNGGFKSNKFDPANGYKYWVVPATHEELQTKEYGKMMDVAIQQHIDGESLETVAERFGISPVTFNEDIRRLRKAGSPIPHLHARACGHISEADPDIFEFVNGHNLVKPSIVQEWVEKRLQGYPATWIAGEYRVAAWTVSRLTKPFMPA